jgi:hypothetical protein
MRKAAEPAMEAGEWIWKYSRGYKLAWSLPQRPLGLAGGTVCKPNRNPAAGSVFIQPTFRFLKFDRCSAH